MAAAPNAADSVQMITIHSTDRLAMRPAAAASWLLAMPTTSKATTSGMTVILSAFSHSVPMKDATPSAPADRLPTSAPRLRPMSSARSAP